MKINEIIRNKRMEQKLTQEQVAASLGVTAPAVNKWEKGVSYPDITLLSPLARLLKVDLNTLMAFNQDLTDREIEEFINNAVISVRTEGYGRVFENCMNKVKEYPTCSKLILNVAMALMGGLHLYHVENKCFYEDKLYHLFEQCADSEDHEIRNQAFSFLIGKYMNQKEFEKAKNYIDSLPNVTYDKTWMQGNLYIAREEWDQASEHFERKLLTVAGEVFAVLISMMEIALKEGRETDAEYYANVIEKANAVFELWDYNVQAAYFQLYSYQKKDHMLIETLKKMLPLLKTVWDTSKTKLFSHIKRKSQGEQECSPLFESLIEMLRAELDGDLSFMKENSEFMELMNKYSE